MNPTFSKTSSPWKGRTQPPSFTVLCGPVSPGWERACGPRPQALAAGANCSKVAWAPMDPAFILFPLPVCISLQEGRGIPKYFSWSWRESWGGGGWGTGEERERVGQGRAFASDLSSGGGEGLACMLDIAVSSTGSVCVWHPAQGRNLKQLSTWSSCSCVPAPPSSEPNSQGSQGKLASNPSGEMKESLGPGYL